MMLQQHTTLSVDLTTSESFELVPDEKTPTFHERSNKFKPEALKLTR